MGRNKWTYTWLVRWQNWLSQNSLASRLLRFCPHQPFLHLQPFFLPFKVSRMKPMQGIRGWGGQRQARGQDWSPPGPFWPKHHTGGQFYPSGCNFPRQPFTFTNRNELRVPSHPLIPARKLKVLGVSKPGGKIDSFLFFALVLIAFVYAWK